MYGVPSGMTYRSEIDGMRALAVLLVMLFHAGFPAFSGGFIGVDVFFVISGYLITSIIHRELRDGRFSLARFYERRARRILPALFLVVAACIPAALLIMLPFERESMAEAVAATTLFASNILFWLRSSYFDTAAELNPLLHTWSLAVEEQFYIAFPLILMALRGASQRTLALLIAALSLASLVLAELVARSYPMAAFYLIPFRAWELGAGALVALTFGAGRVQQRALAELGGVLGLGLIVASAVVYDKGTPFPGLFALAPVLGTCLVITCAAPRTLAGRLLSLKPVVGLGLISYSAYLWHQPLFAFARLSSYHELTLVEIWTLIAATIVLAWLSWRFVETPFRNRRVMSVPRLAGALAPAAAILLAVGVVGNYSNGLARDTGAVAESSDLFHNLYTERLERIGSGQCHFNRRGEHVEIDDFIANWSCEPDTSDTDRLTVAVFGDSIAADLASALRHGALRDGAATGSAFDIGVIQMTGAGCPLVPRLQSPACRKLHEAFAARVSQGGIDEVWVTNWFEKEELQPDDMQAAMDSLAALGVPVKVWSPLPSFGAVQRAYLARLQKGRWPDALYRDDHVDAFLEAVAGVDITGEIEVRDSRNAFCQLSEDCHLAAGKTLFVLDKYSHLSRDGAMRYGRQLAATLVGAATPGNGARAPQMDDPTPPQLCEYSRTCYSQSREG